MSRLEGRARLLLRAYPPSYRAGRGEEILGTLLDASPPGRGWPAPRDTWSLVAGGVRARAARNRQLPLATSLRLALILGAALWLAVSPIYRELWFPGGAPLPGAVYAASALLLAATFAAPWFARRGFAISLALIAALALGALAYYVAHFRFGVALFVVPPLALAAGLAAEPVRPPRCWLWIPGSAFAGSALFFIQPQVANAMASSIVGIADTVIVVCVVCATLLWLAADARLAIALVIWCEWLIPAGVARAVLNGARVTAVTYAVVLVPLAVAGLAIVRLRRKAPTL